MTALALAACGGGRLRPSERGEETAPPASLRADGGLDARLACERREEGDGGRAVCFALGEPSAPRTLRVLELDLDGGAAAGGWEWDGLPDDAAAFRGLASDGRQVVALGRGPSGSSLLCALDPSQPRAACAPTSRALSDLAWDGRDWISDTPELWAGLARFPSLDAVGSGWPNEPLVRWSPSHFAVSGADLYALSDDHVVDVFELCTGARVRSLALPGALAQVRGVSVVGETLYLLEETDALSSSIVVRSIRSGVEIGRVRVPGHPTGLFCSSRP